MIERMIARPRQRSIATPIAAIAAAAIFVCLIMPPQSGSAEHQETNPSSRYFQYQKNPFNPANKYDPTNPWLKKHRFMPESPLNPANRYDIGNPLNPANRYKTDNPLNPLNRYNPDNPLSPGGRFNPDTPLKKGTQKGTVSF